MGLLMEVSLFETGQRKMKVMYNYKKRRI